MRVDDDYVAMALAQLESTRGQGPSEADLDAFRLLRTGVRHDRFSTLGERIVIAAFSSFMIGFGRLILWLWPAKGKER